MKIIVSDEFRKNTLLSHMVLHGLTYAVEKDLVKKLAEEGRTEKGCELDIKVTANGHELNLKSFVKSWENQVDRMIKDKAKKIIDDGFKDIADLAFDLQERLKEEVEKRMEDWEKE